MFKFDFESTLRFSVGLKLKIVGAKMIDFRLILDNLEEIGPRLETKGVQKGVLYELRDLLIARRKLQGQLDDQRSQINKYSKEINTLFQRGRKQEAESLKDKIPPVKEEISILEAKLREVSDKADYMLLRIPNIPDIDCPVGKGDEDNVILAVHNYDENKYQKRSYKPHWEIAEELGIFDPKRASKISGSMFALLRAEGAKLLRALINFGIDLNAENYEEILPPHFVNSNTFTATGHLPKFETDAYKLRDDDLWAIPTGEVPITSLHRDEILLEQDLPKHYMAYTVCFRREAGSAGKDTRGMQRLHEFHKLELVTLCTPEQVQGEFEKMLFHAQQPLKLLNLPYRIVDLCTADLTFSSARIYDLEVYVPGADRWLEVSSVGIFTDFQARRGNVRFRRGSQKPEFVHFLNGSAIATPRLWAAIIEHNQQSDGSIKIPEPLVPYTGFEEIRPK